MLKALEVGSMPGNKSIWVDQRMVMAMAMAMEGVGLILNKSLFLLPELLLELELLVSHLLPRRS